MMCDETNSHYHPKEPRRFSIDSTRSGAKAMSEAVAGDDKSELTLVAAAMSEESAAADEPAAAMSEKAAAAQDLAAAKAPAAAQQPVSAVQVQAAVNGAV